MHGVLGRALRRRTFHQKILERAITLDFFDLRIDVVTLEDLLLLKRLANRPQDKADIAKIHERYQDEIDLKYLDFWTGEPGIAENDQNA